MIEIHLRLLLFCFSLSFFFLVIELIRREKLAEQYSFLWLLTALFCFAFSLWPKLLYIISAWCRVHYLTALLGISFIFLVLIVLHYSIVLTLLMKRIKLLMQEISLLRYKLEKMSDINKANESEDINAKEKGTRE